MMNIGLILALYNANVTTDWVAVAQAAARIPIRAIVPVEHVSPPDPDWPPDYPSQAAYNNGIKMLRQAGVEVYAYAHLRNISRKCCTCCGNLTQFAGWLDRIEKAGISGVMLDNLDAPWSSTQPYHPDGLHEMYIPAARLVRSRGLGVWANGPHVSMDGSSEANASTWRAYLELATFTTLFEMGFDHWVTYPSSNFSATLDWPPDQLGGYVLDIPNNASAIPKVEKALSLAIARGMQWLYPATSCKHAVGPHQGSCTYADLPLYWEDLVRTIEKLNTHDRQPLA